MSTPSNNTDFDALIDLLGIDDDDTSHSHLIRSDSLAHETSGLDEVRRWCRRVPVSTLFIIAHSEDELVWHTLALVPLPGFAPVCTRIRRSGS